MKFYCIKNIKTNKYFYKFNLRGEFIGIRYVEKLIPEFSDYLNRKSMYTKSAAKGLLTKLLKLDSFKNHLKIVELTLTEKVL